MGGQVVQINDYQKQRFVERVIEAMFNTISEKIIAVLGFAFKKVWLTSLFPRTFPTASHHVPYPPRCRHVLPISDRARLSNTPHLQWHQRCELGLYLLKPALSKRSLLQQGNSRSLHLVTPAEAQPCA